SVALSGMVKPISLRLRNAEILAKARATLIRADRGDELKRAHNARVMREARDTVERAKEQKRLKRVAALSATRQHPCNDAKVRGCTTRPLWGQTGKHLLVLSLTAFEPKRTDRAMEAWYDPSLHE